MMVAGIVATTVVAIVYVQANIWFIRESNRSEKRLASDLEAVNSAKTLGDIESGFALNDELYPQVKMPLVIKISSLLVKD